MSYTLSLLLSAIHFVHAYFVLMYTKDEMHPTLELNLAVLTITQPFPNLRKAYLRNTYWKRKVVTSRTHSHT